MRRWPVVLFALAFSPLTVHATETAPTFADDIATLVFENCTSCHRPSQVAPFTLTNYTETRKHAKSMLRTMDSRFMPPWHPQEGWGDFRDSRRLTDKQIAMFSKWVDDGMPEGDPKKTPPLPKFPEGWQLGKPDLIVEMDRPFNVPAEGRDIYQNFVIPLNFTEDKWVTAVEFRATAPGVLHHILYSLDDTGKARERVSKDGQPGFPGMGFRPSGSLGGWAVGATPSKLPQGLALPVKKGSDLVLQTHFHLSGKPEKETITVGLYFAKDKPDRTLVGLSLPPFFGLFSGIDIPAGQANFKVTDSFILPVDVDVVGVGAHAHYLGKTMKATAKLPDGTMKNLFAIQDWDFNWQGQYFYKDFVRLPKGTVVRSEITWDNTTNNPRNPTDPPVRVKWGEESADEMGAVNFRILPVKQTDLTTLQEAVRTHARQTVVFAKLRGDRIDWAKLGVQPPAWWKESPKKSDEAKPEPKAPMSIRDIDGKEQTPLAVDGAKANVLFFVTTDCPIGNSYVPEINALRQEFADKPLRFYAVHVDSELSTDEARKHAKDYGLTLPVVIDAKHQLVNATGVTRTPEVAVVLPDGSLAYRGRIDDRYPGLGKKKPAPKQRDLKEALTAVLAGEAVATPRTEAIGCSIPDLPTK